MTKAEAENLEKLAKAHALAGQEDFYYFARHTLGYKDLSWQTHREPVQVLESKATRKIIVLPRGAFKSTLGVVAYPIWRLLKDPNLTILIDSEVFNNSKNFLREIKAHYKTDWFIKLYGDLEGDKWDESEIIIRPRTRNRKEASITVGGIGTVKIGQHFDLIIGDDYNSPRNSDTPEKCQQVIDHVRYNLNILNPGGEYLLIGTRYAELDISGFFFKSVLNEPKLAEGKLERSLGLLDHDRSIVHLEG